MTARELRKEIKRLRFTHDEILASALKDPEFAQRWHSAPNSQTAEIVRRIRRETGLTQVELAQRAGVGRAFISMVEGGRFQPSLDWLTKVCNAAGYRLLLTVEKTDD